MKKRFLLIIMSLLLTLQLVSCASKSLTDESFIDKNYDSSYESFDSLNNGNYAPSSPSYGMSADDKEEAKTETTKDNDLNERKIIKNANVDFETTDYDGFFDALYVCITENAGYIQSQDSRGNGIYSNRSSRYSNITVRIPADYYDSFMNSVGDIGTVTRINEYQNDVTMNYIDIESHIGALQAEYTALITILEKSTNVNDIITVQSRISEINYQLDTLKSQLRKYDDLISYCTVNISVSEVKRETPIINNMTFGQRIASGLSETFADIGEDFSEFTIWFVVNLPYLLIWGVIIAAIIIVISIVSKKNRRKAEIKRIDKLCETYKDEKKED